MGFVSSTANWGPKRENKLRELERQDQEARNKAFDEQMSLRISGSAMPGPNMPLIGANIGADLSHENARRRAMAMTGAELRALLTKGKTEVAAWNDAGAGGRGTDESMRPTRGFRPGAGNDKTVIDAGAPGSDKPPPPPDPGGPTTTDIPGAEHDYAEAGQEEEQPWQKNMRETQEARWKEVGQPGGAYETGRSQDERMRRDQLRKRGFWH
jgi:hypothetical protein